MKKILAALLCVLLLVPAGEAAPAPADAASAGLSGLKVGAAVLMEKETGRVLYEENAHARLEPASVTKIMTLLLVMEAIDAGQLTWETPVTGSAHACGMGGSQIWLKENESFTVEEMVKAVTVVSANDCSVALAEAVAGSEEAFVAKMNARAQALGMADTSFVNCTGLPAEGHLTSAWDIALMSRALIQGHPELRKFTTIWMDSLRDGASQLVNTNKLIRFYQGATGLKTGFTATARYCMSATAEREGMELIAVVMKAPTKEDRLEAVQALLNYGFAAYALREVYPNEAPGPVAVKLGCQATVQPVLGRPARLLLPRDQAGRVETVVTLAERVEAPVEAGQTLGRMEVRVDGVTLEEIPLVAQQSVERLSAFGIFQRLLGKLFLAA